MPLGWKLKQQDNPEYKDVNIKDDDWLSATVPSGWTKLGINKERTIGWYRLSITLPDNLLNKDLIF
ncbi:MAG: hypothetical protein IPM85_08270 [Chitinophagaceae bacterium]|nr:hypothetical protein [Chitinophagaceae bacterium]